MALYKEPIHLFGDGAMEMKEILRCQRFWVFYFQFSRSRGMFITIKNTKCSLIGTIKFKYNYEKQQR